MTSRVSLPDHGAKGRPGVMAAQAALIAVMAVVAASAVVPFIWLERARFRPRRDANALVLGGAVLGGGQGLIAFGLFVASDADVEGWLFLTPLFIVAAALLAARAALRLRGRTQRAALLLAAVLSLVGSIAGGLFAIAGFAALVSAACYLAGLADNPRALLRRLDPRD